MKNTKYKMLLKNGKMCQFYWVEVNILLSESEIDVALKAHWLVNDLDGIIIY
jgi:hypothetical protein